MNEQDTNTQGRPILSRIQIERVYNLGNYEHIRYGISLDVLPGMCPHEVLKIGKTIIRNLQPLRRNSDEAHAKSFLSRPAGELSELNVAQFEKFKRIEADFQQKFERREAFLELLKSLGGLEKFRDAKSDWDQFDDDNNDCIF